jgi:predicted negative regulator of RcsB-dependent stress response
MKVRSLPLLVLALFCCSRYSLAQRPGDLSIPAMSGSSTDSPSHENTSISGIVQDMHNAPMHDVRVELTDGNGRMVTAGYTNAAGSFEFSHVPPGSYTVVASTGLVQTSEHVEASLVPGGVILRIPADNRPRDGIQNGSVSVAQMRIPGKARDEFRKAQDAMDKDKLDDARKHLEKALGVSPDFAEALTMRAVLELNQNNSEGAMADLDKAIKADPNFAMAYLVMGSTLNMQSKFDDALRALQRGESLAPNSWQAHFEMGKAYIGKEDYQNALSHLQRAQSMAPSQYPLIYLLQAHAHLAMKQYPEAMAALQVYLQKEPQGPNSAEARKMLEKAQAFVAQNK